MVRTLASQDNGLDPSLAEVEQFFSSLRLIWPHKHVYQAILRIYWELCLKER